jgi:hypothetical protein
MLKVGMKVVCIGNFDSSKFPGYEHVTFPVKGSVYTIRAFVEGLTLDGQIAEGLIFEEIVNPISARGIEYSFKPIRFRPVVERKTDISIFTRMLNPTNASEFV